MKKSITVVFSEGSFDSRVFDYINKHNAKFYSPGKLNEVAIKRIRSKIVESKGMVYNGNFYNWLFTKNKVGKDLAKAYTDLLTSIAQGVEFCTTAGNLTLNDIRFMVVSPEIEEVHLVLHFEKITRLCYSDFPTKKVKANDISEIKIRIAEKIADSICANKNKLRALPDAMVVFKHLLPDLKLNTSIPESKRLIAALNTLDTDDEDYKLLIDMAEELLDDMKLIFSDIKMFWG